MLSIAPPSELCGKRRSLDHLNRKGGLWEGRANGGNGIPARSQHSSQIHQDKRVLSILIHSVQSKGCEPVWCSDREPVCRQVGLIPSSVVPTVWFSPLCTRGGNSDYLTKDISEEHI